MNEDDKIRQTRFRAELARGVLAADRARILRKHIEERREEDGTAPEPAFEKPRRTENRERAARARELGGARRFMGTMKAFWRL